MSPSLSLTPSAVADIQTIYDELFVISSELASKFESELRETLRRIEANPECAGRFWRNARAIRVGRFQYVVFYASKTDRTEVRAVLHGARDPRSWKSRW